MNECIFYIYQLQQPMPSLKVIREHAAESLRHIRTDHKRALNPTPYKVKTPVLDHM